MGGMVNYAYKGSFKFVVNIFIIYTISLIYYYYLLFFLLLPPFLPPLEILKSNQRVAKLRNELITVFSKRYTWYSHSLEGDKVRYGRSHYFFQRKIKINIFSKQIKNSFLLGIAFYFKCLNFGYASPFFLMAPKQGHLPHVYVPISMAMSKSKTRHNYNLSCLDGIEQ